jgi:RsiW-degrading membrane proteinase PrsW (M82 family)
MLQRTCILVFKKGLPGSSWGLLFALFLVHGYVLGFRSGFLLSYSSFRIIMNIGKYSFGEQDPNFKLFLAIAYINEILKLHRVCCVYTSAREAFSRLIQD